MSCANGTRVKVGADLQVVQSVFGVTSAALFGELQKCGSEDSATLHQHGRFTLLPHPREEYIASHLAVRRGSNGCSKDCGILFRTTQASHTRGTRMLKGLSGCSILK